jgi:hypothetical protein
VGRIEIHAIVAPVAGAGKFSYRHQLNGVDPEIFEIRNLFNDRFEGAFGGEGSHVQFVHDELLERQAFPVTVGPRKGVRINDARSAVDAFGL